MTLKTAFEKVFPHRWRLDGGRAASSVHLYYSCRKTGDRKVVTRHGPGYQPIDRLWLQAGSGVYYIDGKRVDTVADPSLRAKPLELPPRGLSGVAPVPEAAPVPARDNRSTIEVQRRLRESARNRPIGKPT